MRFNAFQCAFADFTTVRKTPENCEFLVCQFTPSLDCPSHLGLRPGLQGPRNFTLRILLKWQKRVRFYVIKSQI